MARYLLEPGYSLAAKPYHSGNIESNLAVGFLESFYTGSMIVRKTDFVSILNNDAGSVGARLGESQTRIVWRLCGSQCRALKPSRCGNNKGAIID
jgi:hypothetical protein